LYKFRLSGFFGRRFGIFEVYDIFEINTLLENSHISADGYSLVRITLKRLSINEVVTHNACVVIKGKLVKKM
jgi:hypothetical protein